MSAEAFGLRDVPPIVRAAIDAGHEPEVERVGNRFKLVCSCGFSTPVRATRKRAFEAIADHVYAAGRGAVRDTPEVVDIPQPVSGRA